jgi:hypothetical protein
VMAEEVESFVTPPANETMRLHGALGRRPDSACYARLISNQNVASSGSRASF